MVRKAKIADAEKIQALVNFYAQKDKMLPLSRNEVYDRLRDFSVYEEGGKITGCVALHISWAGLAEIRSLAVDEKKQGEGIGKTLLRAAIDEAKALEISRIFTLTFVPVFFEKEGFKKVDKAELPHKIWADCLQCPKFPDCDDVALIREIK